MNESSRLSFGMVRGQQQQAADEPAEEPGEETLPPDAVVDVAAERKNSGIDDVLDALDRELVGLVPVKERVREISALLLIDRMRAKFGIETQRPNLHMCYTGSPGTGKTTVAIRMAELLRQLGYLRRGHLVSVGRDDLVGQYVGHTAPKTKEVIKRAMGGVLFIDEAYYLYRADNERDYGQESIEILLQVMENNRDDLVVILAGYADRMETFFRSNPGMGSRIAHHINFPDFTVDELYEIGLMMADQLGYQFSPRAQEVLREYLTRRVRQPRFANARSVRNAVERARLRQARRLLEAQDTCVGRDMLVTLEAEDLLASRVFSSDSNNDGDGDADTDLTADADADPDLEDDPDARTDAGSDPNAEAASGAE
jgi:probable Rubsico expression protein CbbX